MRHHVLCCHSSVQVVGEPHIRFYAGAPLISSANGYRYGTVSWPCVPGCLPYRQLNCNWPARSPVRADSLLPFRLQFCRDGTHAPLLSRPASCV